MSNNGYLEIEKIDINDTSGNDEYYFGRNISHATITDSQGNDSYNLSGTLLEGNKDIVIDDKDGINTITITDGYTKNNMNVYFNVILDDTSKGYHIDSDIKLLKDYQHFGWNGENYDSAGLTIKDYNEKNGSYTTVSDGKYYLSESNIDKIAADIASWMRTYSETDAYTGNKITYTNSMDMLYRKDESIATGPAFNILTSKLSNIEWTPLPQ